VPGKQDHYTPEFKEQAVRKVVGSSPPRTITEVARELRVNDTTPGFWVKAYRKKLAGQPLPSDMPDGERVRELERR
jgi:transposase-like protein